MLQAGIVGLPNVGKSTLFNALTRTRKAEAANYPFCTIEPNVGVVQVPDERLEPLRAMVKTDVVIPAAIEFVDIAGLVKGASKGEGLGNKFLANIREVDAIVQVVRCFENSDIVHSAGVVNPISDIETINTELILADLESVEKQLQKTAKKARSGDADARSALALLEKIQNHLNEGAPVYGMECSTEEQELLPQFALLTTKSILYACNVDEETVGAPEENAYVKQVQEYVSQIPKTEYCTICSKLEEDLSELPEEEATEFLQDFGIEDSGVSNLIQKVYDLLGLATYLTAGEKEVRAWTFRKGMKAPECAGVIHTDFEQGFIKAEVVSYEDLLAAGSIAAAREAGKYRLEGKEYVFQDGDVTLFRFSP